VRTDASDVVQQTILSAIRNFDDFAGDDEAAFVAWLQKIQTRNVQDCLRQHVRAERRSVKREVALDDSKFGADGLPLRDQAPPEQGVLDKESFLRLQEAVTHLPAEQQEAVRMRHLEGRHLDEIATSMGKSKMAVASLITRGLRSLRSKLSPEDLQDGHS
jgi:RNA polymerase sigma-70 factor (subfamily 1)